MDNIIARYEEYLIHTKHASANTVSSYMRDIRQYASYLSGIDVDVLDADQSVVSAYMQWLQSIGKSPATVSGLAQEPVSVCLIGGRDREEPGT